MGFFTGDQASWEWSHVPRPASGWMLLSVAFLDTVEVLTAKIRDFFAPWVPAMLPEFEHGIPDRAFDLGPGPGFLACGFVAGWKQEGTWKPSGSFSPAAWKEALKKLQQAAPLQGKSFDVLLIDDVGKGIAKDIAEVLTTGQLDIPTPADPTDDPNAPDVLMEPTIYRDGAGVIIGYGFRCRGRGLGRGNDHYIFVAANAAEWLAAKLVVDGKWNYFSAKHSWNTCTREAARQHAADVILPIAAAYKKAHPSEGA